MAPDPPPTDFAAIAARALPGARLLDARRLTGGVSADVHALVVATASGERRTIVVRCHPAADWKARDDNVAVREFRVLQALQGTGIPVPEPLLLAEQGGELPAPYLVMSFVTGTTDVAPDALPAAIERMAEVLVHLHALPIQGLPALPERLDPLPEVFDYLPRTVANEPLIAHLRNLSNSAFSGTPALLHGDFWPGNLMWQDGELAAILDWEDVALGDPMADVAGCRIELLWRYGWDAAERFTAAYAARGRMVAERVALWDVFVASAGAHFCGEWGLEPARVESMRQRAEAAIDSAWQVLKPWGV